MMGQTAVATRYNSIIRAFQTACALRATRPGSRAAMHKLLIILNAMPKQNRTWQPA